MSNADWQANYFMSPQSVAARQKLRAVAEAAALQTDKEPREVLNVLVAAQAKQQYTHKPGAIPEAIRFELVLHDSDELRELTDHALTILESG